MHTYKYMHIIIIILSEIFVCIYIYMCSLVTAPDQTSPSRPAIKARGVPRLDPGKARNQAGEAKVLKAHSKGSSSCLNPWGCYKVRLDGCSNLSDKVGLQLACRRFGVGVREVLEVLGLA